MRVQDIKIGSWRLSHQSAEVPYSPLIAVGAAFGAALLFRELISQIRLRRVDLRGQVVLITGGTRGLGYLLAKEFARQGCRIAVCGRAIAEVVRVEQDLRADNIDVYGVVCDVSDKAQVDEMVKELTNHFGRIDILVNNAGTIQVGPIETATIDDFHDAIDTIFFGHVNCSLAVLPQMRERRHGRIVNITSIGGKVSVPHLLPYSAAKFAAVGFSEGLRTELAEHGIPVITIVPGLMRTGSYLNTLIKGQVEKEFLWFSISDNLPFISIDATRAARQIVAATRLGKSQHIISFPAVLIDVFHRLSPTLTVQVLSIVNRFLPAPGGTTRPTWSMDVYHALEGPTLDALLKMGRDAARSNHEMPGPVRIMQFETDDSYPPLI